MPAYFQSDLRTERKLHSQLASSFEQLQTIYDALARTQKELESKHNKLEEDHSKLEQTHNTFQWQKKKLDHSHMKLQGAHTTLENSHKDLQEEKRKLDTTHSKLHGDHKKLQKDQEDLRGEKRDMEKKRVYYPSYCLPSQKLSSWKIHLFQVWEAATAVWARTSRQCRNAEDRWNNEHAKASTRISRTHIFKPCHHRWQIPILEASQCDRCCKVLPGWHTQEWVQPCHGD